MDVRGMEYAHTAYLGLAFINFYVVNTWNKRRTLLIKKIWQYNKIQNKKIR